MQSRSCTVSPQQEHANSTRLQSGVSQGALAHSRDQPDPRGSHNTATLVNINKTHPSPLLPGLYLRCCSGRHRPGNMAGKGKRESLLALAGDRPPLYTCLPSAVPPTLKSVCCGSQLISTHNTELRNGGQGAKQRAGLTLSPPRVSHQPGTDFCTELSIRYQAYGSFSCSLCWHPHRAGKAAT